VARIALPSITVAIDGNAQHSATTIGAIGGYAVVVATALPELGLTLTSSYLAAMVGDTAASHLCSSPAGPPHIEQHILPGDQPGRTHAQACLLDHVAELQARLVELTEDTVSIDLGDDVLDRADQAWAREGGTQP
jgi:hypothetical protein